MRFRSSSDEKASRGVLKGCHEKKSFTLDAKLGAVGFFGYGYNLGLRGLSTNLLNKVGHQAGHGGGTAGGWAD